MNTAPLNLLNAWRRSLQESASFSHELTDGDRHAALLSMTNLEFTAFAKFIDFLLSNPALRRQIQLPDTKTLTCDEQKFLDFAETLTQAERGCLSGIFEPTSGDCVESLAGECEYRLGRAVRDVKQIKMSRRPEGWHYKRQQ